MKSSLLIAFLALLCCAPVFSADSVTLIPEGYTQMPGSDVWYCNRAGYLTCAAGCEAMQDTSDHNANTAYDRCMKEHPGDPGDVCVEALFNSNETAEYNYSICMEMCDMENCIQLY
jgi:hypothetical protein